MKKNDKLLAGLFIATGAAIIYFNKKNIMATAENIVWDLVSSERINELHPEAKWRFIAFINEAEKQGIKLRVTDGGRSFAKQTEYYAQGRTKPGNKITNAKAGQSYHNYFMAGDVVEIVNGKPKWNCDWKKIAEIGKSFGLEWGGDWKSIIDKPHFQYTNGLSIKQLYARYNNKNFKDGFVNIA
jgi:peptidoglycan LD-endopeptidase CwlK